jgi:hypothetical protein
LEAWRRAGHRNGMGVLVCRSSGARQNLLPFGAGARRRATQTKMMTAAVVVLGQTRGLIWRRRSWRGERVSVERWMDAAHELCASGSCVCSVVFFGRTASGRPRGRPPDGVPREKAAPAIRRKGRARGGGGWRPFARPNNRPGDGRASASSRFRQTISSCSTSARRWRRARPARRALG